MTLGKIQQAWIDSLRKHPERQMEGKLGVGTPNNYKACCLGEALCVLARVNKKRLPFNLMNISDGGNMNYLSNGAEKLGLLDSRGQLKDGFKLKGSNTLSAANDFGATWTEIADFIEAHPEAVFTKSI